jgi:citrate lyase subunit beta/citryl-CoA lyase
MVRLAASEAGIAAFDGAFVDVKDQDGFRREAEQARSFGITCKSCIHPSQVSLANEVFAPSREAIQAALRIVQAAASANEGGAGAFLLDGKMIDKPAVAQAQAILSCAAKYGLLPVQTEIRA